MKFTFLTLILVQCFGLFVLALKVEQLDFMIDSCLNCFTDEAMGPHYEALYKQIMDSVPVIEKRDSSAILQSVLQSLNSSNIVIDLLHLIADSPQEMNTLSNYIFQVLLSVLTGTAIKGLNATVNFTQILAAVELSGIIGATLSGLLLDDQQLAKFAAGVGETLVNNTWIPEVVFNFGKTGHLTFQTIFNLARNTVSKDPGFNGTLYQPLRLTKRDDNSYLGSLQTFINNLIGSGLTSSIFLESLESILVVVKNSGVIISLVQTAVSDEKIQYMGGFIANKLYNYGVFDQIPLDKFIQRARHDGLLKDQTQFILTDPLWLPAVAKLFLQWYDLGVNEQIRRNMYGP